MERLTISVDDNVVVTLRQLAGGERKVGAYLSSVVTWLADAQRQQVLAETPLSDCVLVAKARVDTMNGNLQYFGEELARLERHLERVDRRNSELAEVLHSMTVEKIDRKFIDKLSTQLHEFNENDA